MEPFLLFKRHPLICGLFQFQLHANLQYHSINLVNMAGSVLCAAYLYESCRQAGYLKQIWPDMELIMDIHTREKMFIGRIPQTPGGISQVYSIDARYVDLSVVPQPPDRAA